jgi:DhnA family fructose-bisphosphate aldolase class Ia
MSKLIIPLDVPRLRQAEYKKNWQTAVGSEQRLLLFAGDQKVEHLNKDFYGPNISPEDNDPEHLFKIAASLTSGVFASQLGLISRYGEDYPDVPYIIKLNSKSNLYENEENIISEAWFTVDQVAAFKKDSRLKIVGVGYTVYLGGRYESAMLKEAATIVHEAHQAGLLAIIWMYPRGLKINEDDLATISGGAGVAAALGADFVKIKYPYGTKPNEAVAKKYQEATLAAGRTGVICVGGSKQPAESLLEYTWLQVNIAGTRGLALGRNLHQRPLAEAKRLIAAIEAILNHGATLKQALAIYKKTTTKNAPKAKATKTGFLGLF